MSFLVNYFLIPVPNSPIDNALGNGISGFMGGFMGLIMYKITEAKSVN